MSTNLLVPISDGQYVFNIIIFIKDLGPFVRKKCTFLGFCLKEKKTTSFFPGECSMTLSESLSCNKNRVSNKHINCCCYSYEDNKKRFRINQEKVKENYVSSDELRDR